MYSTVSELISVWINYEFLVIGLSFPVIYFQKSSRTDMPRFLACWGLTSVHEDCDTAPSLPMTWQRIQTYIGAAMEIKVTTFRVWFQPIRIQWGEVCYKLETLEADTRNDNHKVLEKRSFYYLNTLFIVKVEDCIIRKIWKKFKLKSGGGDEDILLKDIILYSHI